MTQQQYIIKRKLNILELGEQLGNVSQACKNLGVSRQHYYDIKNVIANEGIEGLLEKTRKVPRHLNRVPIEVENKLLDHCLCYPTWGQQRMSNELKKMNYTISPGGVRSVWVRHQLETVALRLKRLEEWSRKENNILVESQVQALESHKYELFLHLNDIEHTKTKARHPQTNGCVERLNQIIQNEFYAVAFRKFILPWMKCKRI